MAFFTLNSITIPVASFEENYEHVGSMVRAYDGTLGRNDVAIKRQWSVTTGWLSEADFTIFLNLIKGEGEFWSFDDPDYFDFGSRGRGAVVGSTYAYDTSSPSPKFGDGSLYTAAGNYFEPNRAVDSSAYSIVVWRSQSAGAWSHYVKTSAGDVYQNATSSASSMNNWCDLTSSPGRVRLYGKNTSGTNTNCNYDELILLPYALGSDQIIELYERTLQGSALPRLYLGGDCVPDTQVEVITDLASIKVKTKGALEGGSYVIKREISFEILEK